MKVREYIDSLDTALANGYINNDDEMIAAFHNGEKWYLSKFIGLSLPKIVSVNDDVLDEMINNVVTTCILNKE